MAGTKTTPFRLTDDDLALLEKLRVRLTEDIGLAMNRTDTVRYAIRELAKTKGIVRSAKRRTPL